MSKVLTARCYNHLHVPRSYTRGKQRVSVYVTWSYPGEANRDVNELDNRFSTMAEVRRVGWPNFEKPEYDALKFQQGIAGTLELFFVAWEQFQDLVGDVTGHPVPMYQRVDHAGHGLPLDERILADTDTLMVFGLDHMLTEEEATPGEIEAVRDFLTREGTCLVLGPHHDVGVSTDLKQRAMEYAHHGDALVPRQQRFGKYTRSLMKGLGIPIENRYGLRPATEKGSNLIVPLTRFQDVDNKGWLSGVTRFNFHMHLPHYALTIDDPKALRVLATQPIDLANPHPFTESGNREFNTCVWMPPNGKRAGDILFADSTVFSTLFGVDESLRRFWTNIVTTK
ncbi:MAG: hypothetical protein E6K72_02300 [Candidatus Eisenbacteria bacterium]|uniref:ThuA domain-containing protein n=1 Tax=Eiseniibacteriota bacterium TaxID=2212470 RepID=A0A538T508_UNCEI|nr:MAG: hypothetical protein E6K72_02300 [Candidatus Eisenbacteria bacterium]